MLKTFGQILVSDNPEEGLSNLAEEVRREAKHDLGEYKPEFDGQGKAPAIDVDGTSTVDIAGEAVDDKSEPASK